MRLKVAAVQYDPLLGQRERNMQRVDDLLAPYSKRSGIHILVLPEMAFVGYHFADRAAIQHLVEGAGGPTEQWCARQAQRLGCTVCCGFPYAAAAEEEGAAPAYHNSMLVVGPDGAVLERYHKHFLYITDETWATPGGGFTIVALPCGVKVGLGICMDINPCQFTAPWEAYELANYCLQEDVQVLVFSSNWCTAHPDDTAETKAKPPDRHETLNYWAARLRPLIGRDVYFVAADRVGKESLAPLGREGETTFCGCSCVLSLREPALVRALDTTSEGVLLETVRVDSG